MAAAWGTGTWAVGAWATGAWSEDVSVLTPTVLTTTLPTGYQSTAYTFTLEAEGGGDLTWDVTVGAPPTGVTLSAAGVLSGTPTLIETQAFTVRVTNANGFDTQELSMTTIAAATGLPSYSYIFGFKH